MAQLLESAMGKMTISHLAEVTGVLRWSLQAGCCFFHCTLEEDGLLTIFHEGRTERLSGCSVHAATLPNAMRAAYALCGSRPVQELALATERGRWARRLMLRLEGVGTRRDDTGTTSARPANF